MSAAAPIDVVTLELSFALFGSGTPTGPVTVAVFVNDCEPNGALALIVIVTEPPAGNVGTLPDTLLPTTAGVAQVAPPLGDPQLAVTPVIAIGTVSAQVAPSAALGPAFDTRSV
jgi:hypothetical protein